MLKHLFLPFSLCLSCFCLAQVQTQSVVNWSSSSHEKLAEPNYAAAFPSDEVKDMLIVISQENYALMQEDMTNIFGEPRADRGFSGREGAFAGPPPGFPPPNAPLEGLPPPPGLPPQGLPIDSSGNSTDNPPLGARNLARGGPPPLQIGGTENPMWVEADIYVDGFVWQHVGVRYKGNSTLRRSWDSNSPKMPLKLDFDEFEDLYPDINNQRFYGFKQLSLSNNTGDDSYLRDAASYAFMRDFGLITPQTAWYHIHLDNGSEVLDLGIYTVIEVIDDSVIKSALGDDDGSIFEADGPAASLAFGTRDGISESFEKENRKSSAWTRVEGLYDVLHDPLRLNEPREWQEALEGVFDVDNFLRWLAANTVMQNWDTYGAMAHNYYLYDDPLSQQLLWIAWDYNEALRATRGPGGLAGQRPLPNQNPAMNTPSDPTAELLQQHVGDDWPLISYLLAEPEYMERYTNHIVEFSQGSFALEQVSPQLEAWHQLLAPYAYAEIGQVRFDSAVDDIRQHIQTRLDIVAGMSFD